MPYCEDSIVIENNEISQEVFYLKLKSPKIASDVKPGQFVNIKCGDGFDAFLRRPISVFFAEGVTFSKLFTG